MTHILPQSTPVSTVHDIELRQVQVRTTHDFVERRLWDELMAAHHYLPYHGLFGKAVRHIAYLEDEWLALVGWQAGAFKLSARDRWIGWSSKQQYARLHLIANNTRFVILPKYRMRNLASRVLSLSLKRLSVDMLEENGYPVYLAESFVDRRYFTGACYRAANFRSMGLTKGYERIPGGLPRYQHHGNRKELFMYVLDKDAQRILSADEAPGTQAEAQLERPLTATECVSLFELLEQTEDFRSRHGRRYPLACIVAIAVIARLVGRRGVTAIARFAKKLSQEQRQALGAFYSPSKKCYTVPNTTTFHEVLSKLPKSVIEDVSRQWLSRISPPDQALAMDGKSIRGAAKRLGKNCMTVAAVTHGKGAVMGQVQVESGSSEHIAVRQLSSRLNLKGRIVTADAAHANRKTLKQWVDQGADYVVTLKGNQKTVYQDLDDADWNHPSVSYDDSGPELGHGRIERRQCWVLDASDASWKGYADLPGRAQVIRVKRTVINKKTEKITETTSYAVTSLSTEQADAEKISLLIRGHWTIENSNHYIKDFTYDEDRCRVHVRNLPHNLSCLTNLAISIIRLDVRHDHTPEANEHYADCKQDAIDIVLKPFKVS